MGFLDALDSRQRAMLQQVGKLRHFPPKAPLVYQGDEADHAIIIERGWAKVTSATEDGHDVLLAVRGPGDLIAESAVLGRRTRSTTVIALSPVQALVISVTRFTDFLDSHPKVWSLVTETFVQRLDDADRRLKAHASSRGTQRLAQLLANLAELSIQHSEPAPDGSIEILPPLSQEELGSWMDASRETVARAIHSLRRQALLRTGWRKITVLDLPALRAVATGSEPVRATAGERPPSPLARFEQLSDAEGRVARLAADGLTNREIAERLYVTPSTVEQHLTRVYRKLDVNSRAALSHALQWSNSP